MTDSPIDPPSGNVDILVPPEEPYTNGSLSVVVPMDDFKLILRQMWKSSKTEKKMGELYQKYLKLTTFE